MSLLINDGIILSSPTSTLRNTINSNGNDLEIITNTGDIILTALTDVRTTKIISLGTTGQIHKVNELRFNSTADGIINTSTTLFLKTNNTNQASIDSSGKITFVNQPRMNVQTSSTTNGQAMTLNNASSWTTFPVTVSNTGNATVDGTLSYGRYMKMGNLIYMIYNVVLTSVGTLGTGSQVEFSVPFATTLNSVGLTVGKVENLNMGTITQCFDITASMGQNDNYFLLYSRSLATSNDQTVIVGSQMSNNTAISVSGFYLI